MISPVAAFSVILVCYLEDFNFHSPPLKPSNWDFDRLFLINSKAICKLNI